MMEANVWGGTRLRTVDEALHLARRNRIGGVEIWELPLHGTPMVEIACR